MREQKIEYFFSCMGSIKEFLGAHFHVSRPNFYEHGVIFKEQLLKSRLHGRTFFARFTFSICRLAGAAMVMVVCILFL
jgi:hypothetical protein